MRTIKTDRNKKIDAVEMNAFPLCREETIINVIDVGLFPMMKRFFHEHFKETGYGHLDVQRIIFYSWEFFEWNFYQFMARFNY